MVALSENPRRTLAASPPLRVPNEFGNTLLPKPKGHLRDRLDDLLVVHVSSDGADELAVDF